MTQEITVYSYSMTAGLAKYAKVMSIDWTLEHCRNTKNTNNNVRQLINYCVRCEVDSLNITNGI